MPGPHRLGRAADGIGPKVWTHADRSKEVSVADAQVKIVGGPKQKSDPVRIAAAMTVLLQLEIDVRYPRSDLWPGDPDLELDDPNREPDPVFAADPATEHVFWDGSDVVERRGVVEVVWDGTEYVIKWRSL